MTGSLISRLDACLGLSPDEIVARIINPWVPCDSTMTREQHTRLFKQPVFLAVNTGLIQSPPWKFWFPFNEIVRNDWRFYFVCDPKHYVEGSLPHVDS